MKHKLSIGMLGVGLSLGMVSSGCAPKARPIQGDIASVIEEGIARGTGRFDHSRWDVILKPSVRMEKHQFNYAELKTHEKDLEAYLQEIAEANLKNLSREELLALLINAYNAYTIQSILKTITPDHPQGVASIREIPNVFDAPVHRVGGFMLSLNNIEHNILRPMFKDARVHFAINCASVSCPPLANVAYTGQDLERQLDEAAQRTLQSPDYVRLEGDRLRVTRILDWFGSDFVTPGYRGAAGSVAEYVERYASEPVQKFIVDHRGKVSLEFMPYDWALNRTR